MEVVDGGWFLLGYARHRDRQTPQQAKTAARVRKHRAKLKREMEVALLGVTGRAHALDSTEEEEEEEEEQPTDAAAADEPPSPTLADSPFQQQEPPTQKNWSGLRQELTFILAKTFHGTPLSMMRLHPTRTTEGIGLAVDQYGVDDVKAVVRHSAILLVKDPSKANKAKFATMFSAGGFGAHATAYGEEMHSMAQHVGDLDGVRSIADEFLAKLQGPEAVVE